MIKLLSALALFIFMNSSNAQIICGGMQESALLSCLGKNYKVTKPLSYKEARKHIFSDIDNNNGYVKLVYSGFLFKTNSIPNHQQVNTEHTWPQSKFSQKKIKSDIHHLYPTYSKINGKRGSHPFYEIPDEQTKSWLIRNDNGNSHAPPLSERNNYSEWINGKFEPREDHKGAVARSMLYVYGVYGPNKLNMAWFKPQINTLLRWHREYPVTPNEIVRTKAIKEVQGNVNPFIVDPSLAYRLFGKEVSPTPSNENEVKSLDENVTTNSAGLKIASWNIYWLANHGYNKRKEVDYSRLQEYGEQLNADVIALQEVENKVYARKVFGDKYSYFFSSRSGGAGTQRVGFAIKNSAGLNVVKRDYAELDVGRVRYGVDLTISRNGNSIRLLAVHLKSGCFGHALDKSSISGISKQKMKKACAKLAKQVAPLEQWVDARAGESLPFIIIGDFNRRFEHEDKEQFSDNEGLWPALDDPESHNKYENLSRANDNMTAQCWNGKYPDYIDHIVTDPRAGDMMVKNSFAALTYSEKSFNKYSKLISDHCPISVEIRM